MLLQLPTPASGKTGKIFIILILFSSDSSTIPDSIQSKGLVCKYGDDIFRYHERRESQQPQRIDLKLDAIFVGVLINQATWNLIAHAHLYTQNMEAEKEKVLDALES